MEVASRGASWSPRCAVLWMTYRRNGSGGCFIVIAVNGAPLDALVVQLGSSDSTIGKTMLDARRKLWAVLAANGYLTASAEEAGLNGWGMRRS